MLAKMSDGAERTFVTGVVVKAMTCRKERHDGRNQWPRFGDSAS